MKKVHKIILSAFALTLIGSNADAAMIAKLPVKNTSYFNALASKITMPQFVTKNFASSIATMKNYKKTSFAVGTGLAALALFGVYKYFTSPKQTTKWDSELDWTFNHINSENVTVTTENDKKTVPQIRKDLKTKIIRDIVKTPDVEQYKIVSEITDQYLNSYQNEFLINTDFETLLEDAISHVKLKIKARSSKNIKN